jgi:hypothetical protein
MRCLPDSAVLIVVVLAPVHVLAADARVVSVTNNTGAAASDLHVSFSGTGGDIAVTPGSVLAPAACPSPALGIGAPNEVVINWGVVCVPAGSSATFQVQTPNGPLSFLSGFWTGPGGGTIGVVGADDIILAELDLNVAALGQGAGVGNDEEPEQVGGAIDIATNRVAFTFQTFVKNVGPNEIRWGFPVMEWGRVCGPVGVPPIGGAATRPRCSGPAGAEDTDPCGAGTDGICRNQCLAPPARRGWACRPGVHADCDTAPGNGVCRPPTPWVAAKGGYSGHQEYPVNLNHPHDVPLPATMTAGTNYYGSHVHIQLYIL